MMDTKNKIINMDLVTAIDNGFKYCTKKYEEVNLINIEDCPFDCEYVLVQKNPIPFTIDEGLIPSLIDDYLSSQEEVENDDGKLNDIASNIDYSDITERINKAFSHTKYYYPSDITLIK